MRVFRSERMIDKGIDILVVVFGILIALSIDNYRDYKKAEEQWNMFASQVRADAEFFKQSFTNIEAFYSDKFNKTKEWIGKLEKTNVSIKEMEPFLVSLGNVQIDYPKNTIYEALVQTSNPFLINDTEKLQAMGMFYSFEDQALSNIRVISEHFIPEYRKIIKRFYSKKSDPNLREDIIFLLYSYTRYSGHSQIMYKRQLERTENLLSHL